MKLSRYLAAAAVALAAAGTASVAQARSDVYFSVGANVAPGVAIGVSNAPYYPAYSQPYYSQPYYVQPTPVYYEPAPVYYRPAPVYYAPAPVYFGATYYGGGRRHHRHQRHYR